MVHLDSCAVFLPMDRRVALASGHAMPVEARGAALFADLSGFTVLTGELVDAHGPHQGAEELSGHLNRVFGALVACAHRHRGSVIYFAGDAVLCWFDETQGGEAARRAATAALEMQDAIREVGMARVTADLERQIRLTVAVSAGGVKRWMVGDGARSRTEVLVGPVIDGLEPLSAMTAPGEVRVDASMVTALPEATTSDPTHVEDGRTAFALLDVPRAEPNDWPEVSLDPDVSAPFALAPLRARIEGGHTGYLASLRVAVPMFLRFEGIDYADDPSAGDKLDRYLAWMQGVLARYDGWVLQLMTGDKGSNVLIVFGALTAHEDLATRAIAAAANLHQAPSDLGFVPRAQIGISSGRLFAGTYGGHGRHAFTVLGNETNLAARLMSKAPAGETLVSQRVAELVGDRGRLEDRGEVALKGYDAPVAIWSADGLADVRTRVEEEGAVVGRARLVDDVRGWTSGEGLRVVYEGPAGMGKTRLLQAVSAVLDESKTVVQGLADSVDRATPFLAWRPVVRAWLGLARAADGEAIAASMQARLPQRAGLAPLVGAALGVTMADTPETSQLEGRVRADNTVDVLGELASAVAEAGWAVVLEDLHWFDAASWALLERVSRETLGVWIVATTRPLSPEAEAQLSRVLAVPGAHRVALDALDADGVHDLLAQRLGVAAVPDVLVEHVMARTGGHPYFAQSVVDVLRDRGVIEVRGTQCVLAVGSDQMDALDLPDTIEGVLRRRLDELPAPAQLALRVASVIGPSFSAEAVAAVHPDAPGVNDARAALQDLVARGLLQRDGVGYRFEHEVLRDVVYGSLLFGQRQDLHRVIGTWLETEGVGREGRVAQLAHHWRRASGSSVDPDVQAGRKAVAYLADAGDVSLDAWAIEQAASFFRDALALEKVLPDDPAEPDDVRELRRGRLTLQLSRAYLGLGDIAKCLEVSERTLQTLGYPMPASEASLSAFVLREIVRRRLPGPIRPSPWSNRADEARMALVRAQHMTLARALYHTNGGTKILYSNTLKLKLAEWRGTDADRAHAYGGIAYVLGLVGMTAKADALFAEAIALAESSDKQAMVVEVRVANAAYLMGAGRTGELLDSMAIARPICETLGDRDQWGDCVGLQADALLLAGRVPEAKATYEALDARAQRINNHLHQIWAIRGFAQLALRDKRPDEAQRLLERGLVLLETTLDKTARIDMVGLLAVAHQRQGQHREAFARAAEGVALIDDSPAPTAYGQYLGYGSMPEVLMGLSDGEGFEALTSEEQAAVPGLRKRALKALSKYSGAFKLGLPQTFCHRGRWMALRGKTAAARKAYAKGLEHAERLGLPYEVDRLKRYLAELDLPAVEDRAA